MNFNKKNIHISSFIIICLPTFLTENSTELEDQFLLVRIR